ncbi:hypothetical protein [Sphingobium yanoikuyae]|jgi:hypothetical protein|uniref:hypothetical protein n=1 Tax=Sphingobium yanoikuyae TaxID=13690 RepID=UPI00241E1457|nr:hypothetical protein [Sphingobium yanoikuyae]
MKSEFKGDIIVARSQSLTLTERPVLATSIAVSSLLTNTLGSTILVVSGERGGAGVDTLVACVVALCDAGSHGVQVIELGTSRGYLAKSLGPEEYRFVSVTSTDFVADLITAMAEARAGVPMILSVNAAAFKDFVAIESELLPWIDQAPERYCLFMKLGPRDDTSRAEDYYRHKSGLARVIRCFTAAAPGLRSGDGERQLRHDPDHGVLQIPRLAERLQMAFYDRGERISAAMAEASIGEAALFARAMKMLAAGLEDVL